MSTDASKSTHTAPSPPDGSPCWIEIMSVEPQKLKEFYTALFPSWGFKAATEQYKGDQVAMYEFEKPAGLYGGIVKLPEECPRGEQANGVGSTVYYFAKSIEETEKRVHELGGTTCLEKREEGSNGWFANFKDPEGNRFGVYEVNWANMKSGDGA
ncbi:hypothetical protein K505DRAFT_329664 [Melanomma pulvis-pyrius CBS 109.77]|uniref:VOC domain-containing protein n=1 Tax=Melanomma pulvis-pyrius CBS 109.77 TaxID=1314802 RepID=A0A6A6WU89_9PLEO|nr:hypothetical protein K505DRAFT_329664 [Melanomma pulvis-pyrius CBS 109.77]